MCLLLTSCRNKPEVANTVNSGKRVFTVIKIDGCEYISEGLGLNDAVLTHKGNCSNPIHNCNCK